MPDGIVKFDSGESSEMKSIHPRPQAFHMCQHISHVPRSKSPWGTKQYFTNPKNLFCQKSHCHDDNGFFLANDSNFDRNPLRGCNYGSEGGAVLNLGGCSFDVRGCSLMHNIKELQISIFSASNAIIFPFWCPTLCWNRRTLSVQFRFQHLSASFSYSGWYAQGLPRSP